MIAPGVRSRQLSVAFDSYLNRCLQQYAQPRLSSVQHPQGSLDTSDGAGECVAGIGVAITRSA